MTELERNRMEEMVRRLCIFCQSGNWEVDICSYISALTLI